MDDGSESPTMDCLPLSPRTPRALKDRAVTMTNAVRLMSTLVRTKTKWINLSEATKKHHHKESRARELAMIERFVDIDPMDYFSFPPSEPPPPPPPLEMDIYPHFAEFIEIGGASKHVITNKGTQRIVWKVRCSNNAIFKVAPVYYFLDPGQSYELHIVRGEGPVRKDKLVIMYKEAKPEETNPKASFPTEGVTCKIILPLIVRDVESSRIS